MIPNKTQFNMQSPNPSNISGGGGRGISSGGGAVMSNWETAVKSRPTPNPNKITEILEMVRKPGGLR
jgi:hypothetical protein